MEPQTATQASSNQNSVDPSHTKNSEAELVLKRAAVTARQNAARTTPKIIDGSERIPGPVDEDRVMREMERERNRVAAQLFEASGIPTKYREIDLGDLSEVPADSKDAYRSVVARLRKIITEKDGIIVGIVGARGPGKTSIGCGLVRDHCRRGESAIYLEASDYFEALKGTWHGEAMTHAQVEGKFIRPKLVVIDSMEERGNTEWEDRMLTRLVNKRYSELRSTILISNQEKEKFIERVGPSIADRIYDGGLIITCGWDSLRGRI